MSFSVPLQLLSQCQLIIDADPTAPTSYRLQAFPSSSDALGASPQNFESGYLSTNIHVRSTRSSNGKLILEVTASNDSSPLVATSGDSIPGIAGFPHQHHLAGDQPAFDNLFLPKSQEDVLMKESSYSFPPSMIDDHSAAFAVDSFEGGVFPDTYWDHIPALADTDKSAHPNTSNPFSITGTSIGSSSTSTTVLNTGLASPPLSERLELSDTPLSADSPTSWKAEGARTRKNQRSSHRARPFPCTHPHCDRSFTSNYTLETHMLSHKPKKKQSYQCTIGCGALFSRKHDRQRHEVSQHGKPTNWVCSHCSNFFSSEKTLSSHMHNCQHRRRSKTPIE